MPASLNKQTVIERLADLARADPYCEMFGTGAHAYRLNPTLARHELESFESKHRIQLPDDYRMFITELGNGGAGPYYGVFPFGHHDDGRDLCMWDCGSLVGDLSLDFAHDAAWNASDSLWSLRNNAPEEMSQDEEDRMMEAWDKELEEHYWNPKIMAGAIPICHLGCALRQWLVVTGPQRGFVWGDDRADESGIYPLRNDKNEQITFSDWYTMWLSNPRVFTKRQWPNPNVA